MSDYILTDTINQSFSSIFAISTRTVGDRHPNQPFGATATCNEGDSSAVLAK